MTTETYFPGKENVDQEGNHRCDNQNPARNHDAVGEQRDSPTDGRRSSNTEGGDESVRRSNDENRNEQNGNDNNNNSHLESSSNKKPKLEQGYMQFRGRRGPRIGQDFQATVLPTPTTTTEATNTSPTTTTTTISE